MRNLNKTKKQRRERYHKKIRIKIYQKRESQPRLCVFRSNKHIYAQVIDDGKGKTLVAASDLELGKLRIKDKKLKTKIKKNEKTEESKKSFSGKVMIAYEVGKLIARKALEKKIEELVFDRGGYKYHGRVKALAEGAREVGLKF